MSLTTIADKPSTLRTITLDGRRVKYTIRESSSAQGCRVRVGPAGVQVIMPTGASQKRVRRFLRENTSWVLGQVERVSQLLVTKKRPSNQLLVRGESIRLIVEYDANRSGGNTVLRDGAELRVIVRDRGAAPERTFERWLRYQARIDIESAISKYGPRVRLAPKKVYIMGQRTKWGNCSAQGNLSFNWRLILAPRFVLEYVVAHELTHLSVPDHSDKFWLTVRSLCPHCDAARRWLKDHSGQLMRWRDGFLEAAEAKSERALAER